MTTEQLQELARLTMTVRDVLAELRIIVLTHAGSPTAIPERTPALALVMSGLQADVNELANRVQDIRVTEWLRAHPLRPRTSSDVEPHLVVKRCGIDGRPKGETTVPASSMGRWQTGTLGRPKPRRPPDAP